MRTLEGYNESVFEGFPRESTVVTHTHTQCLHTQPQCCHTQPKYRRTHHNDFPHKHDVFTRNHSVLAYLTAAAVAGLKTMGQCSTVPMTSSGLIFTGALTQCCLRTGHSSAVSRTEVCRNYTCCCLTLVSLSDHCCRWHRSLPGTRGNPCSTPGSLIL